MGRLAKIVRWQNEPQGSRFLKWLIVGTTGEVVISHACIETALDHIEKINNPLRNKG